jgi:hypothetical protein
VLPKPDDCPISRTQAPKVPLVSASVHVQFQLPELRQFMLPRWKSPSVPKIAIYEDCDLLSWKDDVRRPMQPLTVSLKAQADPAEFPLNQ